MNPTETQLSLPWDFQIDTYFFAMPMVRQRPEK